ncbi:hypothetical protein ACQ4PT_070384 [Festuca glaucescens]
MRSIVPLRGICSLALGSGRRPLSSSTGGSAQRPTHRTAAAMAKAARSCRGRFCRVRPRRPMFGSIQDAPAGYEKNPEAIELARFAVAEHNTKANTALEFEKVVKVRGQLVAGTMHYFTIEVNEGGARKLYEAKVWVKEWESIKGLQEFKPAD